MALMRVNPSTHCIMYTVYNPRLAGPRVRRPASAPRAVRATGIACGCAHLEDPAAAPSDATPLPTDRAWLLSASGAIISVGKFAAIPFCSWCDSDPFPHRVASIH